VNQYFTHWWDPSNVNFPNFSRYLAWVSELHVKTALPQIVWQVPVGNQYFLTMSNSCGHYQDNVAQYFIAHASDLFNAGLIAVLFGAGNSCQTSYDDAAKDGVSNNNGMPTNDVLGGCSACNIHPSTWADDDGGYLRTFVGRYYAGTLPCTGVRDTATPPSPGEVGAQVQVNAIATDCSGAQYEFWVLAPGANLYTLAQPYSATPTMTWNTSGVSPGTYRINVWVRSSTGGGLYGNAWGSWDAYNAALTYTLSPGCASVTAAASPTEAAMKGVTVTITAATSSCIHGQPLYEFWVLAPGANLYTLAQAYSSSPTFNWGTASLATGTYRINVWIRDSGSAGAYGNSWGTWDAYNAGLTYAVTPGCPSVSTSATAGTPAVFTAAAPGCPNPLYEFWVLSPGATFYTLVQPYSSSSTFSWSTAGNGRGAYRINVWVRDAGSAGGYGNAYGRWDAFNANLVFTLS